MANIGEGRTVTFCPVCRQADDHPKHAIALEDNSVSRHMDCCRDSGCPTGACDVLLGSAKPGAGRKMLDHIVNAHAKRDVAAELEDHKDKNPGLRQFTVPGATPIMLSPADGSQS